jgi:dTDP-4-dehydrorhamnose 3,5-epimerase
MLPGVRSWDLAKMVDERGFFAEAMRSDWADRLEGELPVQTNVSYSYPDMIRAWHRHRRGQIDYFVVVRGALKICAYDGDPASATHGQLDEIVASSERLQVVRIPGKYWHGTKTLGHEPSLTVYSVSRLYDPKDPDEDRRPWNDATILDPRTGKPFDWNRAPHK